MSLVTRCPACQTLFRVNAEQLQLQSGQVRCGRCMTVFDGYAALATLQARTVEQAEPIPDTVESSSHTEETGKSLEDEVAGALQAEALAQPPEQSAARPLRESTPEPDNLINAQPSVESPAPVAEQIAAPTSSTDLANVGPASTASEPDTPSRSPVDAPPVWAGPLEAKERRVSRDSSPLSAAAADRSLFHGPMDPRPRSRRTLWGAGSLLLLLGLLGQAAYGWRDEVSARLPVLRPAYSAMCATLGCTVNLPQGPKLINIEASDLQVIDPARPSVIELTATLRNHASHVLGYPALDLVLTDSKEHALARRIFTPREYVSPTAAQAGIAPSAEITVRLTIETGDLGASGFRLDLLPAQ